MKHYKKHSLCFFSIPAVCMMLVLASCTNSEPKVTAGIYGKPISYIERTLIEYPDFSLRFIEKHTPESASSERFSTHSFEIANGEYSKQINWQNTNYRTNSYESFLFADRTYFLDLKRSDFLGKTLAGGDVVVWTSSQYEQFEYNRRQAQIDKMRGLSALDIEHGLRQSRRETGRSLFKTYKGYLQAHDMVSEDNDIADFLSKKNLLTKSRQAKYLFFRQNPNLDTLQFHDAITPTEKSAKLYLSALSAGKKSLIGVTFIKQQGQWKIADEQITPDNAAGKEWIARFIQAKQES